MEFLWFLIIGAIAGWLAGQIMKGGGFGIIVNIVVGIIGAVLGGWLFSMFGIQTDGGIIWSLLVATVGAIVLLFVVGLFKKSG